MSAYVNCKQFICLRMYYQYIKEVSYYIMPFICLNHLYLYLWHVRRWQLNFPVAFPAGHVRVNNLKLHKQWSGKLLCLSKNSEEPETDNVTKDEATNGKPSSKASERSPKRGRKKKSEDSGGITVSAVEPTNGELDENIAPVSKEKAGTVSRRSRKKGTMHP